MKIVMLSCMAPAHIEKSLFIFAMNSLMCQFIASASASLLDDHNTVTNDNHQTSFDTNPNGVYTAMSDPNFCPLETRGGPFAGAKLWDVRPSAHPCRESRHQAGQRLPPGGPG